VLKQYGQVDQFLSRCGGGGLTTTTRVVPQGVLAPRPRAYFHGRSTAITSNPVINGDIWFGDGPYKSRDGAKLACSTIRACPAVTPDEEKDEDSTN
jgi:hypothetical protein